jgi:ribosome-associated protein
MRDGIMYKMPGGCPEYLPRIEAVAKPVQRSFARPAKVEAIMLQVAPGWVVPAADLEYKFVRSSGPGGQNVNKVATKVELRLKLAATTALSLGQKQRLIAAHPSHVTVEGDFILTSDRFRSQPRNQRDAEERLVSLLLAIRTPPRRRLATRPSRAAKARRLSDKRARGDAKAQRRRPSDV